MFVSRGKAIKRIGLVAVVGVLLVGVIGCGQSSPAGGPAQPPSKPIKIGLSTAITGAYSEFGESSRNVVQLAIDEWNAKGGIKGRQIELIAYDDQLVPDRSQTNMRRLLEEDKVDALLAPAGSGPSLAVLPLVNARNKVMVGTTGQTATITYPNGTDKAPYKNIYTMALQSFTEAQVMGEVLGQNWKKIGLIAESTSYGSSGLDDIEKVLQEKYKLTPVGRESYKQKDPDMTAQIARLQRAGAEVIAVVGLGNDAATLRKDLNRLAFKGPLVGALGVFSQAYQELAGDLVDGTIGTMYHAFVDLSKGRPEARRLAEAYKKKFGNDRYYGPNQDPIAFFGHTAASYDAAIVLFDAMNRAESLETNDIVKVLESGATFAGARADYTLSAQRHHGVTSEMMGIYQYVKEGGKFVLKEYKK